jgi:ribosome-associated protein
MDEVEIRDEVIRLGQLLKLAGLAENGGSARSVIEEGDVLVDGQVETRRGRQLHPGAVVTVYGKSVRVVRA